MSDSPPTKKITDRASPTFRLLQLFLIKFMSDAGTSTADIAAAMNVNRSYVIRLAEGGISMAPNSERERTLFILALETFSNKIQQLGLKGLLSGATHTITLAGNKESERPKLGPLADRRAAKAEAAPARAEEALRLKAEKVAARLRAALQKATDKAAARTTKKNSKAPEEQDELPFEVATPEPLPAEEAPEAPTPTTVSSRRSRRAAA